LSGGCATAAEVTGTATQQDLMQIRADVAAMQLALQRSKFTSDTVNAQLDRRNREHAAEAERQVADLGRRVESLSAALATLSGRVDEMNSRVEALNRQLRAPPPRAAAPAEPTPAPGASTPSAVATAPPPGVSGPSAIVSAPPSTATTPSVGTPPPGSTAPGAPGAVTATPPRASAPPATSTRPTTGALQPQDIYQASYLDFSKGSYPLAIAGFREFVRRFPDHELAGNAQYWIGEAHYSIARGHANSGQADKATEALEQAVTEFRRVVANYPRGEKVPAALFKEALALIDLKQPALAQARLQYLIDNFPQAEETPLARDRLSTLRSS
jgi:TolA-binding protein